MFHARDCKTGQLFDKWAYMGPKRRKLLDDSWAGLFRREILPELPVEKLATSFDEINGRPSKEIYTTLGVLIFQQMLDLTDEETVRQLAFDLQWHFALDLSGESDTAKYICPRTLWTMRGILTRKKLDTALFSHVTDKLSRVFSVDTRTQRLDSVHVFSNMAHLGRIGIFVRVIRAFLVNLKRHQRDLFESLDGTFSARYLPRKGQGVFSMARPSETDKTLQLLATDLFDLLRRFADDPGVSGMDSYKKMSRVLSEQCTVESARENGGTVTVKPPGEVRSDSLQNPSDPDATYCGHKGQGYQAQVMETYIPATGADGKKAPGLSLITHVAVEPAHASDAHALIPAIEDVARGNHRDVIFATGVCFGCPRKKECPIKSVRRGYGFSYDRKQVKMARRRALEKTEKFRDRYRFRAGIEGAFSALDRLTGVKHLRVRGMPAVRFAVVLKVLGLNLLRAAAVRRPGNGGKPAPDPAYHRVLDGMLSVHGKFTRLVRSVVNRLAFRPVPALPTAGSTA